MLFKISRTSDHSGNEKPVEDAVKCKEFVNSPFFRVHEIEFWAKEFNSLEDILNFIEKEGNPVIIFPRPDYMSEEARKSYDIKYEIEIYDDWRE